MIVYVCLLTLSKLFEMRLGKCFLMKEASIGEPDVYLGGKVRKVELESGESCLAFSSSQYVKTPSRMLRVR